MAQDSERSVSSTEHTENAEMKHLFMASAFLAVSFAAFAETSGVVVSQSEESSNGDERRERYRRRHEMLMERAMKRGQVVPVMPVAPVVPVAPVMAVAPVSLYVSGSNNATVADGVSVKVHSLTYDESAGRGVLSVEVIGGSFSAVNRYIRANIGKLARNDAPGEAAPKIPPDARLKIESITVDEDDVCEVKFRTHEEAI